AEKGAVPAGQMRWLVLTGIWLLYFSFGLGVFSLAPLVQPIMQELEMNHTGMGTVMGTWQFIYLFWAIPSGYLISKLGPRKSLFIAAALVSASCFFRSQASDFLSLWLAVALFGLGGPIVSTGAPYVAARWFHGPSRGFAMGVYVTGPAMAAIVSFSLTNSVLMPAFGDNWRTVLQLWAGVAAFAGVYWVIVATIAGGRRSTQVLEVDGIARFAELWSILRARDVQLILAMSIGVFSFNHGLGNWLPELLRTTGLSAVAAGYWAAVPEIVGIGSALLIPRLAVPQKRITILALLFTSAGLAALFLSFEGVIWWAPALFLKGVAVGSMMAVLTLTLVESPHVGPRRAGLAGGLFFTFAEIGGVSGPVVLGALYDVTGGFAAGLNVLALTLAVLVVLTFWLRRALANPD
ncbi:MAG: MFS transporter, partial [Hyphomicrobiales bacterium]